MRSFVRNNSLLLNLSTGLHNATTTTTTTTLPPEPSGIFSTLLASDILAHDLFGNTLYHTSLAMDSLLISQQNNTLYQSSMHMDILCSDSL